MKFEVLSSELQSRLAACARVLNSRNSLPALNDFLFTLSEGRLTVTASDGDNTMMTEIPVSEVEGEVTMLVAASNILSPLSNMPAQNLSVHIAENYEVTVTYQNGRFTFLGTAPDAYPSRREMEDSCQQFSISSQALASGLQNTLFAVSTDDLRIIMNGVLVDIMPECVTFVSSDSKRLVKASDSSVRTGLTARFVLPKKTASLLKNIIGKEDYPCSVTFDTRCARIVLDGFEMDCRFIEGRYPNYNAVIPKNNENIMTVCRASLLSVLRRISAFSNIATNQVKLELSRNSIQLSAQDVDYCKSGSEHVTCAYEDKPMALGLRGDFIIECLNTLTSDEVELSLSDPARAVVLSPVCNGGNQQVQMLLMPMLLTD